MATISDHPYDYVETRPEQYQYVEEQLGRPMMLSIVVAVVLAPIVSALIVFALR